MKCAGYWGQELRADTVEFHCNRWPPVKDPDTFDGRRVVCSSTWLVRIEIDANYFTCAVCDCLWRLDMSLGMSREGCTPPRNSTAAAGGASPSARFWNAAAAAEGGDPSPTPHAVLLQRRGGCTPPGPISATAAAARGGDLHVGISKGRPGTSPRLCW